MAGVVEHTPAAVVVTVTVARLGDALPVGVTEAVLTALIVGDDVGDDAEATDGSTSGFLGPTLA